MSIEVHQLGADDVIAYRAIRLEALQAFPESYISSFVEAKARPLSSYAQTLSDHTLFGAFVDGELSGIVSFRVSPSMQENHIGHLNQMYVRANTQGKGIGFSLIEDLVKFAFRRVKQIFLAVGTDNKTALALYMRCGFEIYGTEPRTLKVNGKYIDEHLMVKYLDRQETK